MSATQEREGDRKVESEEHATCRQEAIDVFAGRGIEVKVTTVALSITPYTTHIRCPHAVDYFVTPTAEQIDHWDREGVV